MALANECREIYAQSKSEVIRAGLRLLEEHEARTASASREDLSRVIQTALLDTRPIMPASKLLRRRRRPKRLPVLFSALAEEELDQDCAKNFHLFATSP